MQDHVGVVGPHHMHAALVALSIYEPTTLLPTCRRNREEPGEDCMFFMVQRRDTANETCCARFLGRYSLSELSAGTQRWESSESRHEKQLKDTFEDEIKIAGLEASVLEELESHLVLSRNCF